MSAGGPLVVSLVPRSFAALDEAVARAVAGGHADVIELRLDHVAAEVAADPEPLGHVIRCAGLPFIAAIHGEEGFGGFRGSVAERCAALEAAGRAGVTWVDVDETVAAGLRRPADARLIVSTHRVRPAHGDLDAAARRLDAIADRSRGDLVKLVPACDSALEGLAVLDWVASRGPGRTVAFGSGEAASFTRLLAPAFGSALSYGAPDAHADLEPAAPGQLRVAHVRRVWAAVPPGGPGPGTSIAAVCGRPIGHSLSPVVHGAAARELGLDALLVPVAPDALEDLWRWPRVRARLAGLSVTAPFKGDAARASTDPAACPSGAANTLLRGPDGWRAANTDEHGVLAALEAAGAEIQGAAAAVIGAGGAARAAATALVGAGATVTVLARRGARAEELAADLGARLGQAVRGLALDAPDALLQRPSIVVHATPVGTGDPSALAPVPDGLLGPGVVVLDAVYAPRRTALLARAEEAGATAAPGIHWFLAQAWRQHVLLFRAAIEKAFGPGGPGGPGAAHEERARDAMERAVSPDTRSEPPRVLSLVGLRGSGKSTVGALVADRIGARSHVDLDRELARRAGMASAGEVLRTRGERAFRELEAIALREVLAGARAPMVLSAGGGAVEGTLARALLRERTLCVWLDASPAVCRARVERDAGTLRPPLLPDGDARDEFEVLHGRRAPLFGEAARWTVDAGRAAAEVAAEVAALWLDR